MRMPVARDVAWSALRAIPSGYLLIGNTFRGRPRTFRSTDGETWERVEAAPWLLDAASSPDGVLVGIADQEMMATPDLVTWEQVGQAPLADSEDAGSPLISSVDWAGGRFAVSGMTFSGCPEGVDECDQRWLYVSPDGTTWTESTGPDGVPGTDASTSISDMATLGDTTVVLGSVGPGPTVAWIMPG